MEPFHEAMEVDTPGYHRLDEVLPQDSDSDADPNEATFRPRRQAGIRARSVIASACGVKNRDRLKIPVKKENGGEADAVGMENFFEGRESALKDVIKTEVKLVPVKKNDDEVKPRLTQTRVSGLADRSMRPNLDLDPQPVLLSPTQGQPKRQRETFDCVLLTSRNVVIKRPRMNSPTPKDSPRVVNLVTVAPEAVEDLDDDEETVKEKMMKWKNKKVKKNENLCLLPQTLRDRIKPIGLEVRDEYITVDLLTREHMVTRKFMSETYGGSSQATQPIIGRLHAINHPYRDFFYMTTDFQPEAPEVPGAPGLWLSTEPAGWDIGVKRVITKIRTRKQNDNKWLYVGQYDLRAANPPALTVEEWKAQSSSFHNAWASAIVKSGWGSDVCIRLYVRKLHRREPTDSEYIQMRNDRSYSVITEEEVKEAYLTGQELMGVWTAKCVGYDNAFQQELSEKFTPDWRPRTPEERKAWVGKQKAKLALIEAAKAAEGKMKVKRKTERKVKKATDVKVKKETKALKVKTDLKQEAEKEQDTEENTEEGAGS